MHTHREHNKQTKKFTKFSAASDLILFSVSGEANKASLWKVGFIPGHTCVILGVRGGSCFLVWAELCDILRYPRASYISIFLHCTTYNFLSFYLEGSKQLHKLVLQKFFKNFLSHLNTTVSAFIFLELSATSQLSLLSCLFTQQLKPFALSFLILIQSKSSFQVLLGR